MELAEIFFSQKSVYPAEGALPPFFGRNAPFPPPSKKTASAAKPILACLYKTLTMGARRSCGKLTMTLPLTFLTFWTLSVPNSTSTLLVIWDGWKNCRKPPRYVPYNCTYVLYDGTFGMSDQGQTLDVWQDKDSQIHHLIRQIHRFNISSNRKKSNHEKYRWIGISATILIHTDKK